MVYTVRALRWGCTESHSYIVGVYSTHEIAQKAATDEEIHRGGKYECVIQPHILNHYTDY